MKRPDVFSPVLFVVGCVVHAVLSYFWGSTAPAPQELLLATAAVGALGRVDAAQTLGFLWGLALDVNGAGIFGAQAWVLATVGFVTARLSKQVDAEKVSAQMILGGGVALFHLAAMAQTELFFRRTGTPHLPPVWAMLVQILMSAVLAPLVFRAVQGWARLAPPPRGGHVFRR